MLDNETGTAVPRAVPRWFWVVLGVLAGSLLVVFVVAVGQLQASDPDRRPTGPTSVSP